MSARRLAERASHAHVTKGVHLSAILALLSFAMMIVSLDPPTYAVVAGVLIAVTLLASLRPARRAARVDPMIALRGE